MKSEENMDILLDKAAEFIAKSQRVVVFTGAGISTESGIPDFRSPGGFWSRYDPEEFTYQAFIRSKENRKMHWKATSGMFMKEYEPNPAHYAIAELDKLGKLDCIITQNVDNLHQKAGVNTEKVYELHGNTQWIKCLSCGKRYPSAEIRKRLEQGEEDPDCPVCHGILKADAVFFGESLPQNVLDGAIFHAQRCDLCLVVGSTLVVYPAAYMPVYALEGGANLIIVNMTETPMDHSASVVLRGKAGEILPKVVEKVKITLASSKK